MRAEVFRGLARRAEAARGPDRLLDGEVWCAVNGYEPVMWDGAGMVYRDPDAPEWNRGVRHWPADRIQRYSASLDAGITTISGAAISISDSGTDGLPRAQISDTGAAEPLEGVGSGHTLPLALLAASMDLRAKQAARDLEACA